METEPKTRMANGHARPFTAHTISSHTQLSARHYHQRPQTAVIRVPPQKREQRVSDGDAEEWGRVSPNHLKYGTTRSLPAHQTSSLPSTSSSFHSVSNHTATRRHRPRVLHAPSRRAQEDKESAVRQFEVELEQLSGYQYRPGEQLAGRVCLEVRRAVEIRFVELVIVGVGSASLLQPLQGAHHTAKETYLYKRTYIIGTPDNRWTSVLTPGRYVSSFRFKLPRELPSSLHYDNKASGFALCVEYYLKARVCDDYGNASVSSRGSLTNVVKVLVSRKLPFTVLRSFDVNLVPGGLEPVSHQEDVLLSCLSGTAASVTLHLDRTVYLAGDDVRLEVEASLPNTQKIRELRCLLQQNVLFRETGERKSFILSQMCRRNPSSLPHELVRERSSDERSSGSSPEPQYYEVSMPTDVAMVPSFLQCCKIVKVTYCLLVHLKFSPAGGKLSFTIPLAIGPAAEPIYTEKAGTRKALPVFNRPVRFPCFSPSAQRTKMLYTNRAQSTQSIQVVTKYSNNFLSRCFLCCCAANDDL